jgi:hypothetical protein|tara:strand:- start:2318 stop:2734 length:417 start_codon:yes stop_codon:yes gene_type:complete
MNNTAVNVRFPAPLPAEIPCPVCRVEQGKRGGGCIACDFSGKLHITVDAKIPIQRGHIIKYVADNMKIVSVELTKKYGLVPEIETVEVFECENGQFEVVQISSIGGACWVVNRLDDFESPKYFTSTKQLRDFKKGVTE